MTTMAALFAFALLPLVSLVSSQFIYPPQDLTYALGAAGVPVRYKEVPTGICETNPDVKSYSGYADVGPDQHIFWWFFEARNADPTTAPLTVWINGGPGSSSMIGLFQELGPCRITNDATIIDNPYSWSNTSNLLFIDQPVTVGLSYSIPVPGYQDPSSGDIITLPDATCPEYPNFDTCGTYSYPNVTLTANSTESAAPNMYRTLQGFMGAFPQYSRNGFHFTTESYGGHYAPVFNEYFLEQNALAIPGTIPIDIRSVAIGNGWYNPLIQYGAYFNFTVYPGNTYDYYAFNKTIMDKMFTAMYGPGNCHDQIKYCHENGRNDICAAADNFCANQVELVLDIYGPRDEYDFRYLTPDPFPTRGFTTYLNKPEVQAAIGAFQNFSSYSNLVGTAFAATGDDARQSMTVQDIRRLLRQGVTVHIYAGDADYNCNWLGSQVIAHNVLAPGFENAGYTDIITSDGIVHGQVKQAGKFSFARIYYAGHEVPFYQPLASLEIFDRVVAGLDVETGFIYPDAAYVTTGTPESTFREGPDTVQTKVIPMDWVYNTTTAKPQPPSAGKAKRAELEKRSISDKMARNPRWAYRQMLKRHIEQSQKGNIWEL